MTLHTPDGFVNSIIATNNIVNYPSLSYLYVITNNRQNSHRGSKQRLFALKRVEPRHSLVMPEKHVPCFPVPLFRHDQHPDPHRGNRFIAVLDLLYLVIFRPVQEANDVGILLYRTRFTEVGEHRFLVRSLLRFPVKLREHDEGNVQLLGDDLRRATDVRNFLFPVPDVSCK